MSFRANPEQKIQRNSTGTHVYNKCFGYNQAGFLDGCSGMSPVAKGYKSQLNRVAMGTKKTFMEK